MDELREAPVSGHIFRTSRQSGDRWMAKWRDAAGQHQRVIGKAWIGRGDPATRPCTVDGQSAPVVHGILKRAQRAYGLPFNAASVVERQLVRRSGDFEVYSPEEVAALARAAASPQDGAMYVVAAYTGVRLGELLALRWRDIDYGKRLVHVRRSYVTGQEEMPKSPRVRSVPMTDQVMLVLDGLSRRQHFAADEDLVFPNALRRAPRWLGAASPFLRHDGTGCAQTDSIPRSAPHVRHTRGPGLSAHRR